MTSTSLVFCLDGAPISWNELYASPHWSVRKRIADAVHDRVWLAVAETLGLPTEMLDVPVDISIIAYSRRPVDADNICAKVYIDGLVGLLIPDDNYKIVRSVFLASEYCGRDNERVVISVMPYPDGEVANGD